MVAKRSAGVVSATTLQLAAQAMGRLYSERDTQHEDLVVRQAFFRRPRPISPEPPLTRMLHARRGGADSRVRLYLWLLAEVQKQRDEVPNAHALNHTPLAQLAECLGLQAWRPPTTAGARRREREMAARRVSGAARSLAREALLLPTPDGATGRWVLGSDDGSGQPYSLAEARKLERRPAQQAKWTYGPLTHSPIWEGRPVRVPIGLWVNGWLSTLPATAVAALLVLLDSTEPDSDIARVPKILSSQYALHKDAWHDGLAALRAHALVEQASVGRIGSVPVIEYRVAREALRMRRPDVTRRYPERVQPVRPGKYRPLAQHLADSSGPTVRLTFTYVEQLLGAELPPGARNNRDWWSKDSSPQVLAWQEVQWRVEEVRTDKQAVTFRYLGP